MAEVVICYSSKDRQKVMPFVQQLRSMGVSVWIDYGGIDGALLWGQEIVENIERSRVLILIASKSSMISDHVRREVTLAFDNKKYILPLHIEPVDIPKSIKYQLVGIQHIELFPGDFESNFPKIAQSLEGLGVRIEESTAPAKNREPLATPETDAAPHLPGVVEPESQFDERVASAHKRDSSERLQSGNGRSVRNKALVIVGVAFVSMVAVVLAIWFTRNSWSHKQAATETQPSPTPQARQNQPTPPAGMVYASGGTFTMGRDQGDEAERPAHQKTVAPFFIDLYEITNEDYEKFVQATSHRAPLSWINAVYPSHAAHKPVTGVTWEDANAYTRWAKKRLPTEEEWEFAARGTDSRLYPWGNAWQQGSANADGAGVGLADVGSYRGISPVGAFDMVGNAWEWTASELHAYPKGRLPANLPTDLKVIRGGSYESTKDYATTTYRTGWPAHGASTYAQTGFRCAADITR
jgi:formylglycine-generating enzyme required for sulfatase activity